MTTKTNMIAAAVFAAGAAVSAGLPKDNFSVGTYCIARYAQTEAHIRDLKECGIDYVIGLSGSAARPLLAKYGIREIVGGYIPHPPGSAKAGTWAQTGKLERFDKGCARLLADYDAGKLPTFAALSLGDEPNAVDFPHLAKTVARTHAAMKGLPLCLNLFPSYAMTNATAAYPHGQLGAPSYREYIDSYCRYIPIDHICWDFYMYASASKAYLPKYYENFTAAADACRRTGRSLMFVGQVNSLREDFWVSENQLRFQGYSVMAFGGEAISWACWSAGWWKNFVVDGKGRRTRQYAKLKKVNAELKTIGREYMRFRNTATYFVGFPPGCPDLAASDGVKPLEKLDDGFIRGLKATDGDRLLVGGMVAYDRASGERAYFVLAADDPFDEAPRSRTVTFFLPEGFSVRVIGGEGAVPSGMDASGNRTFGLKSNSAALLVISPVRR